MENGGKRPGAGRKPGKPTKKIKARIEHAEKALAEGMSPLQVMLGNMRHFYAIALKIEEQLAGATDNTAMVQCEEAEHFRLMAQKCAVECANYVHSKFATIEQKADEHKRVVIEWKMPQEIVNGLGDMHRGRPTSPSLAALKTAVPSPVTAEPDLRKKLN
jgi:hypothetical protein